MQQGLSSMNDPAKKEKIISDLLTNMKLETSSFTAVQEFMTEDQIRLQQMKDKIKGKIEEIEAALASHKITESQAEKRLAVIATGLTTIEMQSKLSRILSEFYKDFLNPLNKDPKIAESMPDDIKGFILGLKHSLEYLQGGHGFVEWMKLIDTEVLGVEADDASQVDLAEQDDRFAFKFLNRITDLDSYFVTPVDAEIQCLDDMVQEMLTHSEETMKAESHDSVSPVSIQYVKLQGLGSIPVPPGTPLPDWYTEVRSPNNIIRDILSVGGDKLNKFLDLPLQSQTSFSGILSNVVNQFFEESTHQVEMQACSTLTVMNDLFSKVNWDSLPKEAEVLKDNIAYLQKTYTQWQVEYKKIIALTEEFNKISSNTGISITESEANKQKKEIQKTINTIRKQLFQEVEVAMKNFAVMETLPIQNPLIAKIFLQVKAQSLNVCSAMFQQRLHDELQKTFVTQMIQGHPEYQSQSEQEERIRKLQDIQEKMKKQEALTSTEKQEATSYFEMFTGLVKDAGKKLYSGVQAGIDASGENIDSAIVNQARQYGERNLKHHLGMLQDISDSIDGTPDKRAEIGDIRVDTERVIYENENTRQKILLTRLKNRVGIIEDNRSKFQRVCDWFSRGWSSFYSKITSLFSPNTKEAPPAKEMMVEQDIYNSPEGRNVTRHIRELQQIANLNNHLIDDMNHHIDNANQIGTIQALKEAELSITDTQAQLNDNIANLSETLKDFRCLETDDIVSSLKQIGIYYDLFIKDLESSLKNHQKALSKIPNSLSEIQAKIEACELSAHMPDSDHLDQIDRELSSVTDKVLNTNNDMTSSLASIGNLLTKEIQKFDAARAILERNASKPNAQAHLDQLRKLRDRIEVQSEAYEYLTLVIPLKKSTQSYQELRENYQSKSVAFLRQLESGNFNAQSAEELLLLKNKLAQKQASVQSAYSALNNVTKPPLDISSIVETVDIIKNDNIEEINQDLPHGNLEIINQFFTLIPQLINGSQSNRQSAFRTLQNLLDHSKNRAIVQEYCLSAYQSAIQTGNIRLLGLLDRHQLVKTSKADCLQKAVKHKSIDSFRYYSDNCSYQPGDYDDLNQQGLSLLHQAIKNGDLILVKALLRSGADPNQKTSGGDTPLHLAVMEDNPHIVKVLLDEPGIRVDIGNKSHQTPEDIATRKVKYKFAMSQRVHPDQDSQLTVVTKNFWDNDYPHLVAFRDKFKVLEKQISDLDFNTVHQIYEFLNLEIHDTEMDIDGKVYNLHSPEGFSDLQSYIGGQIKRLRDKLENLKSKQESGDIQNKSRLDGLADGWASTIENQLDTLENSLRKALEPLDNPSQGLTAQA